MSSWRIAEVPEGNAAVLVTMNSEGRLTIPVTARRELGLEGDTQFQVEVRDGALVLRPVVIIPLEDAWAYTPEHRAQIERAQRDARQGWVRQLSEADLDRLAEEA